MQNSMPARQLEDDKAGNQPDTIFPIHLYEITNYMSILYDFEFGQLLLNSYSY